MNPEMQFSQVGVDIPRPAPLRQVLSGVLLGTPGLGLACR